MSHSITGGSTGENYKRLDEVLSGLTHNNGKMLVVAAADVELVQSFVNYLSAEIPRASIDLLIQKDTAHLLQNRNNCKLIEVKRHGKKSFKLDPRAIWLIMNNGYQLAWIISDSFIDIQNNRAKLYVLSSGAKRLFFVNASYSAKEDNKKEFFKTIAETTGKKIFSLVQSWIIGLPLHVIFYLTALILKVRRKVLKR